MRCANNNCNDRYNETCRYDTPSSNFRCKSRTISVLHPDASDASGLMPAGKCSECPARIICDDAMFDDSECNEFYSKLAKFIDKKIMEVLCK